jgi:hypothetical protein
MRSLCDPRLWLFAVMALAASARCASASEIVIVGRGIVIGGTLNPGDQYKFRDLLAEQKPGSIGVVFLASGGGSVQAAHEIGQQIRSAGLSTVVDAARFPCASACTAVFLAGAKRIYIHPPSFSGVVPPKQYHGLGFHQGSVHFGVDGGSGTAAMISICYEFGVPKAAALMDKAPMEQIYQLSGADALATGVATSLMP